MNSYAISAIVIAGVVYIMAVVLCGWTIYTKTGDKGPQYKYALASILLLTALYIALTLIVMYI